MNTLIVFLADFCRTHRLEEKVFIVPSYSVGRQIGERLARTEGSWLNLRFVTLPTLAVESVSPDLSHPGKPFISESESLFRLERLFRRLREERRLVYFDKINPTPGVIRSLHGTLSEMRMAGLVSTDVKPSDFGADAEEASPNLAKGRDILLLLGAFEGDLEADGSLDLAGLYSAAIAKLGAGSGRRPRSSAGRKKEESSSGNSRAFDGEKVTYLSLRDRPLARLEKEFIDLLSSGDHVLVPGESVFGIERPPQFAPAPPPSASRHRKGEPGSSDPAPSRVAGRPSLPDVERLPWLFAPASAPPSPRDGSLSIMRAVGRANECREIFRRLLQEKVRLDQVEVIHPPGATYPTLFYLLAVRTGLAVTFAEGIPIAFSSSGRAFFGLMEWLQNNYLVSDLCGLIESGDLRLSSSSEDSGPAPSPSTISRILKKAMIGWGRQRYLERLQALEESLLADLEEEGREEIDDGVPERVASARDTIASVVWLQEKMRRFLDMLPDIESGNPAPFDSVCRSVLAALREHTVIRSDFDKNALAVLTNRITAVTIEGDFPRLSLEEALERLRTMAASLSAGVSPPLPGHLHLASFASGGYSGRPLTFVVGLDERAVPGRGLQDPILLDGERERLSPSLRTSAEGLRENLYAIALLLASLRGRVVLSYPTYDVSEGRPCFPSSILLQAYRLINGDPGLDYTRLEDSLPESSGFLPDSRDGVLDEMDWWLARLNRDGRLCDGTDTVMETYTQLKDGVEAVRNKEGPQLTAYDGIVELDQERFNPMENHELVMSASRLERLASCPYGYFLRYILGIKPPEEIVYDPSRWLDPPQRGTLLHEIFCVFMTEMKARGEKPVFAQHRAVLREAAEGVISRWKEEIPPPSPDIFENERADIIEILDVFLTSEVRRDVSLEPVDFEKSFDRVIIAVDANRFFLLRGFIDRIDRMRSGSYRIIDYKTGSYSPFEKLVEFGQGKIIQHALYAVAAETDLGKGRRGPPPHVEESGYSFPTPRGEGREIMVRNFSRDRLRALLVDLFALLERGYFPAGPQQDCTYCDFIPVCGGAPEGVKAKREANPDIFAALDRLKTYA